MVVLKVVSTLTGSTIWESEEDSFEEAMETVNFKRQMDEEMNFTAHEVVTIDGKEV